jgi:predicted RNase H-like HicB family nuclease
MKGSSPLCNDEWFPAGRDSSIAALTLSLRPAPLGISRMTLQYAVRIERLAEDDGGGYLAVVPDLPGCMSDGATPEEALKNVQEAIASWIEAAKEWQTEVPESSPPLARTG